MFANLEVNIRFLRLGIHTHDAAAITPFCVITVPRPVRVEHLVQEELVLLLVYLRRPRGG
jgi:hypothetical protein